MKNSIDFRHIGKALKVVIALFSAVLWSGCISNPAKPLTVTKYAHILPYEGDWEEPPIEGVVLPEAHAEFLGDTKANWDDQTYQYPIEWNQIRKSDGSIIVTWKSKLGAREQLIVRDNGYHEKEVPRNAIHNGLPEKHSTPFNVELAGNTAGQQLETRYPGVKLRVIDFRKQGKQKPSSP